jgi:putative nucleotidyltransferase with HDIG domain
MTIISARHRQTSPRIRSLQIILLSLVSIISYGALVLPSLTTPAAVSLNVGDVSPSDFQAPQDIEYISEVRTQEARLAAENAVVPVYAPPDTTIARGQIDRLRAALQYITLVRGDENATEEQKASDIASLSDISIDPETIEQILGLTSTRWDAIQQESLSVLEQVMRRTIRDNETDSVRRTIPSLVSLALNDEQAVIVVELVSAFIIPNSLYSADLTESTKQSARDAVVPVVQSYKAGEVIILRGQIIRSPQLEALQQLGLIEQTKPWQDYAGAGALVLALAALTVLYFSRRRLLFLFDARSLVVVALIVLVFVVGARFIIPDRIVLPYAYPLASAGLLIATMFGLEAGIIFSLLTALLVSYAIPNTPDLTPYYLVTSLVGVLMLGSARRVWTFFRAGMAVSVAGIVTLIAFRLPFVSMDGIAMLQLAGAAVFSGLASSSIALLLQFFLAQTLGLTTALQLIEISRPDFPLLQFFLRHAPGTYQHSLQVANLAEQAAELIGADALLTRVGALFHDVGKSLNPTFFIENQASGTVNPHEALDPQQSAAIIIAHVTDGAALARKHRLPRRIDDFILEHHGTMVTRYQQNQAIEAAGGDASKVDDANFRYPGPSPRSRETALLMLADGTEARTRAARPQHEDEIRDLVLATIEAAQKQGQLDNTQLTFRDLNIITDAFVTILKGTHHSRIPYPKERSTTELPVTDNITTVPHKR